MTRAHGQPGDLIRFVAAPDGTVVADLKRNLPGRGCWVGAERKLVEKAAAKNLFARALKAPVKAPPDLAEQVDSLLLRTALGALGLARKAGAVALGATKVETAVRGGKAIAVLHAREASEDGVRKLAAARKAAAHAAKRQLPAYRLFSEAELSLSLGATNVIHAALLAGEAGKAALKRVAALDRYRGTSSDDRNRVAAARTIENAAEDTE